MGQIAEWIEECAQILRVFDLYIEFFELGVGLCESLSYEGIIWLVFEENMGALKLSALREEVAVEFGLVEVWVVEEKVLYLFLLDFWEEFRMYIKRSFERGADVQIF